MDFIEIVTSRYGVRDYQDKVVPNETINELLEMIGYSVSAINLPAPKLRYPVGDILI